MIAMRRGLWAGRRMPWWQRALVGVVAGLLAATATVAIAGRATAQTDDSGSGTVAGVPATSSEVTVSGRGQFSSLKITVSQTKGLVNQAVGISWTGGAETVLNNSRFYGNFLQVFQCWGNPVTDANTLADADNDVPSNPGPPREQCEFGGGNELGAVGGKITGIQTVTNGQADNRQVNYSADPTTDQDDNLYNNASTDFAKNDYAANEVPFRAVDGTVITHEDPIVNGITTWENPYFDESTSNEDPYSFTWANGTGSTVFEVDTGLESSGLGCGEPVTNGSSTPRECWLVIVPRGDTDPVTGQPLNQQTDPLGSPLASVNWQNRIAIPMDFDLVSSPCPIGVDEHETEGSELVTSAVASWQSHLCATSGTVIGYSALDDDEVRQQLVSPSGGTGEMGFLSRPVDPSTVPSGEQIVYAPVTLSGVTISFEIDDVSNGSPGPPVTQVNLTPRLVAKLLTDSYQDANQYRLSGVNIPGFGTPQGIGTPPASDYTPWLLNNPETIFNDPEFQQVNPQLSGLTGGAGGSTVMVELTGSDAAYELWSWILANPAAKDFLEGQPDPWGMVVDPYYSINPKVNPDGAAISLPSTSYPSPDPWCGYFQTAVPAPPAPPPLCMTDIDPYIDSMSDVAQDVFLADNTAKTSWAPGTVPATWSTTWTLTPPGSRSILGVTSTDSADKYGVIDASLQNAAGNFVAPDTAGLLAGEAAMQPSNVPGVLAPDFTSTSPDAYPLAMLTYAAVPLGTVSKSDCAAYAALLQYAAGSGQTPGSVLGDLPPGYVPLPTQLTTQAQSVAAEVAACPGATGSGTNSASDGNPSGTSSPPGGGTGPGSTPGTPGSTGSGKAGSGTGAPGQSGAVPSGGPANVSQGIQLTGGITPASPSVFGYALPIGAITGALASLAAPLIGRRRGLRLLHALRFPQLPGPPRPPRSLGPLRSLRPPRLRGPWRWGGR